jgi:hypothetical protein
VVGLQRSTYYDIKHHKPNDRELRRLLLADAIADIHTSCRGTYGMLRVRAALEIERGVPNVRLLGYPRPSGRSPTPATSERVTILAPINLWSWRRRVCRS